MFRELTCARVLPSIQARPLIAPRTVAVIGAGAFDLATARELVLQGHSVVVYERETQLDCTWAYTLARDMGVDDATNRPSHPLCILPHQPPSGSNGFQSFLIFSKPKAREGCLEVSGPHGGVGVFEGFGSEAFKLLLLVHAGGGLKLLDS